MSTSAYAAPTTYAPAAATATGYQQYMQYAHSPQYHGAQLSQAQYIQADANHDGMVSQAEMQAAQPVVRHGLFGQHHGLGIYDHFVNHGAGGAQLAAQAGQTFTYAPATHAGYQQFAQYSQAPQYQGVHLTEAQYMQADTNHDGKISAVEIQAFQTPAPVYHQPAPVYHQPAHQPAQLPTASSMVAYPQQTYMPAYQSYQAQFQHSGLPVLTAQQFAQADTNHDGKVSSQEVFAAVAAVGGDSKTVSSKKKKVSKKKKKGGCC